MRKIEDNKYYIQIYDILFIEEEITSCIPKSIWDKFFSNEEILDTLNKNNYIELSTEEEIAFFNAVDYIILENDISELSIEDLNNQIFELKKKCDKLRFDYDECKDVNLVEQRKNIDLMLQITKHQHSSLIDYTNAKYMDEKNKLVRK